MLNKEDFSIIKEIPAKKAEIKDLREKSARLDGTKESLSEDTYKQLAEKYGIDLARLEEELKAAQQKAEQVSVEIGFDIDKAESKREEAVKGLSELDTLESSGAISAEDAKVKRKNLETQKRQAEREAAKNRKDRDLVQQYRTAESPEEIQAAAAAGGGAGGDFMAKLKEVPKKVYMAVGAGLAGIAVIIILIAVLAGGGGSSMLNDFMGYLPADIVEDSSVELYFVDMEKMSSSAATRGLFEEDPIELVNEEVVYRLEDDFFYEDFDPESVKSLAVLYTNQLDDEVCYVVAEYDRENLTRELEDEGFEKETYGDLVYYTDSYEAIILTKDGFCMCDDDDITILLETAAGESESILESDSDEKDFIFKYADSSLGFMMTGGYYDNTVSGGIWQNGNTLRMKMLTRYGDKEQADQFLENFNTMMKGQQENEMFGKFSAEKVDDKTLRIEIIGITDPNVIEMFF
ncbi:MAG: hypothetical protein ACLFST_11055 [Spirochaetia bacterium]